MLDPAPPVAASGRAPGARLWAATEDRFLASLSTEELTLYPVLRLASMIRGTQ